MILAVGRRLISCSADMTLKVWELEGPMKKTGVWKCAMTLSGDHPRVIYSVDWCKNSGMVATGCEDNVIRVYTLEESGELSLSVVQGQAHEKDVNCVSWNPKQSGTLASCSDDRTIKLWQVAIASGGQI